MNFLNMNRSKLLGGILVLVALCAGAFLLFGGLGGNRPNVPVTGPSNSLPGSSGSQTQGRLGAMFVARSVNNNGCPAEQTTRFNANETIYVGLERSQIPQGTRLFARLSQNGQPIEDTKEIVSNQDMNACVWFEFAPSGNNQSFDAGSYSAEVYMNGNRAGGTNFEVAGGSAQQAVPGTRPGGSSLGDIQLGQGYIASQVDNNGCPANQTETFDSNEPVYVAFERSFVPSGTEVFARLNYGGQPVEDTDPIVADRDTDACFWFVFKPDQSGFNSGNYTVDVFVNGGRTESLPLQIR